MCLFPSCQQEILRMSCLCLHFFLLSKSSRYNYPSVVSWQLHWLHLYPQSFGNIGNSREKYMAQKYSKCVLSSFSIYTHYLFYLSKLLKKETMYIQTCPNQPCVLESSCRKIRRCSTSILTPSHRLGCLNPVVAVSIR